MSSDFRLLMLSAMYENGGNVAHRFLDGHPRLRVYPFESQLGTSLVADELTSLFPVKYRWPVFALEASPEEDYAAIIDEEFKVRSKTPRVSKFRHVPFDLSDDERREAFVKRISGKERSRANIISAFFEATFEVWRNCRRTGNESVYVGYSPIVIVDAERILADFPHAHVAHVVRNPWSAYADTKKRPVPLSLEHYLLGWTVSQYYALLFQKKYPDRVHLIKAEDLMEDSIAALRPLCDALAIEPDPALGRPTWNGVELREVYPWGTIRQATPEANKSAARELSAREIDEVRDRCRPYLDTLGYTDFS